MAMMCLLEEIIAIILGYKDISVEDIINFRSMGKQFRWTAKYERTIGKRSFRK
ncbi:f-box only protein 21, partial [Lasius niger]